MIVEPNISLLNVEQWEISGIPLGFGRTIINFSLRVRLMNFVLCDLNTHMIKYLGVCEHGQDKTTFLRVFKYKESLVSIKAGQMENRSRDNLRNVIKNFFIKIYD